MSSSDNWFGPVPVSVIVGSLLISASVVWAGLRLESASVGRPAALPSRERALPVAAQSATTPVHAPSADTAEAHTADPYIGMVRTDSFLAAWEPTYAAQAERECWTPLERAKRYPVLPAAPQFTLEVSPEGVVEAAVPEIGGFAAPPTELFECVARIVKTMKFPPSGKAQHTFVQASRPVRK